MTRTAQTAMVSASLLCLIKWCSLTDCTGNPIGGLVFSSAFNNGKVEQIHEWTNYMSSEQFCIRACKNAPEAPTWCQHIYDVLGCSWNMPGNYDPGLFEKCQAESGEVCGTESMILACEWRADGPLLVQPMGVYGGSTFRQGEAETPAAHPPPSSSMCTTVSSIGNLATSSSASNSGSTTVSLFELYLVCLD